MIVTKGLGSSTLITKGYGWRFLTKIKGFIKRLGVIIDTSIPKLIREVKK